MNTAVTPEKPKTVVKVEILHEDALGYGLQGMHTRREWRKECLDNLLAGKEQFEAWQASWKDDVNENLLKVSHATIVTYDDGTTKEILNDLFQRFSPTTLDFVSHTFEGYVKAAYIVFTGEVNFKSAAFTGNTNFNSATFTGNTNFSTATFTGFADFSSAKLTGNADFKSATFGGEADFRNATFKRAADFRNATFKGEADFRKATFTRKADFISATFTGLADFSSAKITGLADFSSAKLTGNTDFRSATITGNAIFRSAMFTGNVDFRSATFTGNADFRSATFTVNADFSRTAFTGDAYFRSSTFTGDAYFRSATFTGDADFSRAAFAGDANFSGATFTKYADFFKTKFINQCRFDLADTTEKLTLEWLRETWFMAEANFENAEFQNLGHFEGARFKTATPKFRGCKIGETRLEFEGDNYFPQGEQSTEAIKNISFLKRLADEHGQTDQALMFNAMELKAKRAQSRSNTQHLSFKQKIRSPEYWFANATALYERFSDYGRSFTKPLIGYFSLLLITFTLALVHAVYYTHKECKNEYDTYLSYVWREQIQCVPVKPKDNETQIVLSGWRAAVEYTSYRASGILDFADSDKQTIAISNRLFNQPIEPPWMRAWGIFKGIASIALLFLAALGLRNKYRIK